MTTNFQKYLDNNYREKSDNWKKELSKLDLTGDFNVADAEDFFKTVTEKSVANWAVSLEIKTRHAALKKIIDSV